MIYMMSTFDQKSFQMKCLFLNKIEDLKKRKTDNKTYIEGMKYLLIKSDQN